MAEKNVIDPSNASDLTPTSDYISHHLTNLTYGWCEKSESWGFAYHQQTDFPESPCKVSEMVFWAFLALPLEQQKQGFPEKFKTLQNMFLNSLVMP